MKTLIISLLILIALAATMDWLLFDHTSWKHKDICVAGKVTAPCDSWQMKWQPFKVKIIDRKEDK